MIGGTTAAVVKEDEATRMISHLPGPSISGNTISRWDAILPFGYSAHESYSRTAVQHIHDVCVVKYSSTVFICKMYNFRECHLWSLRQIATVQWQQPHKLATLALKHSLFLNTRLANCASDGHLTRLMSKRHCLQYTNAHIITCWASSDEFAWIGPVVDLNSLILVCLSPFICCRLFLHLPYQNVACP